jgi:hypothetical protein
VQLIYTRPGSRNYYVRVDVGPTGRRKEIWRSLKTADAKEAKRRAPSVIAEIQARVNAKAPPRKPVAPIGFTTDPHTGLSERVSEPAMADMTAWFEKEHGPVEKPVPEGESIRELWARYRREAPGAMSENTAATAYAIIQWFDSFLTGAPYGSASADVKRFTRAAVRDWKDGLFKFPRKAGDTKAFKGLSFKAVLAASR